ncbi:hypothetical protein BDN70DRAFT_919690, partial [Pholiota conissans]
MRWGTSARGCATFVAAPLMSESLSPSVIVHQISHQCHWPSELADTTFLLSERMWMPERYKLSARAAQMYEQMMPKLPSLPTDQDSSQDIPRKWISHRLDTILTIVHLLRSYNVNPGNQKMRFIWTSLFAILGSACSKDSLVLTDILFLWPQAISIDSPNKIHDGHAALLVSVYMASEMTQEEAMDFNETEGTNISVSGYEFSVPESVPRLRSLDGPTGGHILPGSGRRVDCVLPVICVADNSNIRALVVSTVYQRYAWGIDFPVVGISIEDTGVIATVVIGWVSVGKDASSAKLPTVHLTLASGSTVDSRLGIFDLSDPISILQFSRFILSLHRQFSDISAGCGRRERRDICWRLDQRHEYLLPDGRCRINEWVDNIDSGDCDLTAPLEMYDVENVVAYLEQIIKANGDDYKRLPFGFNSSELLVSPDRASYSRSGAEYYTASEFAGVQDSIDDRTAPRRRSHAPTMDSESDDPPSHYSVSAFVQLEARLLELRTGIERWLWERCSLRVGCIKLNEFSNKAEIQLNEMIDHYVQLFELKWPDCWQNTNNIVCDPVYRPLLDSLFAQYELYVTEHAQPVPSLNGGAFSILTSQISIFLSAVSVAHQEAQKSSELSTKANIRSLFDLLLNLFWRDTNTNVSDSYFQDREIQFATNKAIEGILWDKDQALLHDNIIWIQRISMNPTIPVDVSSEIIRRSRELGKFRACRRFPTPQKLDASERSAEPTHGIVDGIATTRVSVDSSRGSTPIEIGLPRLVIKYQDLNSP